MKRDSDVSTAQLEYWAWINERPSAVRELLMRFPIWNRYKILAKPTFDGRVIGVDIMEGGELCLRVTVDSPLFPRQVFGIKPEDVTLTVQGTEQGYFDSLEKNNV